MKIFDYSINLYDTELIQEKQIGVRETKDYYISANNWLPVNYNQDCAIGKMELNKVYLKYGSSFHWFSIKKLNNEKIEQLKLIFIEKITEIIEEDKKKILEKEKIVELLKKDLKPTKS
jgi:translation elongation factor EF-G